MKLVSITAVCFLLLAVQFVQAEPPTSKRFVKGDEIVFSEMQAVDVVSDIGWRIPRRRIHPRKAPTPIRLMRPSFPIPKGKFGIQLKDGTKMIGVPKTTTVTLQTTFGNAMIPREQISKIETANGITRVHLQNGDRISATWVTTVMQFETQFGTLKVPVASLVWLRTSNVGVVTNDNQSWSTNYRLRIDSKPRADGAARPPRVKLDIRSVVEPAKR